MEDTLSYYCTYLKQNLFELSFEDVFSIAMEISDEENTNIDNVNNSTTRKFVCNIWVKEFLNKNSDIISKEPQNISVKITQFFNLLKELISKYNFSPSQIYAVDEAVITATKNKPTKVFTGKEKIRMNISREPNASAPVSAEICFNAAGYYVSPLLVFPAKKNQLKLKLPSGTEVTYHPTGFLQRESFAEVWFTHFIRTSKPSESNPVLLIVNGYINHIKCAKLINCAKKNNVYIISVPLAAAFVLHPLEMLIKRISEYYDQEVMMWRISNPCKTVTIREGGQLFCKAFFRAATMKTAMKAFRETGIYPLNLAPLISCESEFGRKCSSELASEYEVGPILDRENCIIKDSAEHSFENFKNIQKKSITNVRMFNKNKYGKSILHRAKDVKYNTCPNKEFHVPSYPRQLIPLHPKQNRNESFAKKDLTEEKTSSPKQVSKELFVINKFADNRLEDRVSSTHHLQQETNVISDITEKFYNSKDDYSKGLNVPVISTMQTEHRQKIRKRRKYGRFECPNCHYEFTTNSNLRRHMKNTCLLKRFKCTKCNYKCSRKSWFIAHMARHSSNQESLAPLTEENLVNTSSATFCEEENERGDNSHQTLPCPDQRAEEHSDSIEQICNNEGKRKKTSGNKNKFYTCPDCERCYTEIGNLKRHRVWHCKKRKRCAESSYQSSKSLLLETHLQKHCYAPNSTKKSEESTCPIEESDLKSISHSGSSTIEKHNTLARDDMVSLYRRIEESKYPLVLLKKLCLSQCKQTVSKEISSASSEAAMNITEATTTDDMASCDANALHEEKTESYEKALKSYLESRAHFNQQSPTSRVNTSDAGAKEGRKQKQISMKSFIKCPDCSYKSIQKGNLIRHMLRHTELKLFKCSECHYECNQKLRLKQHIATHSEKLLKCPQCDYKCHLKYQLKCHILSKHTDAKLLQCSLCDYETNFMSCLRKHELIHSVNKG